MVEVLSKTEPESISDVASLGRAIEPLIGVENPSKNVIEGAIGLLEGADEAMRDGVPTKERLEAEVVVLPVLEGTALRLSGVVDAKDDKSDIEDYAITEVVSLDEVAGDAGGSDDMDGRSIEEDIKVQVVIMTSSPDVMVV
ncbi:hypothetical protein E8E12_003937 [Didymella heteroderae]|uniref:Uncharacterized protein n=1 Tax=Didymella heteroderae TaxID=1769908 RepID=A0A9P4WLU2_9PLEO|nr:hypothetical protein E8E12_003937 [Didymella heteroderae]